MYISDFIIEVTRKCNLLCEHCMRGKSQNKDMDIDTVRKFLQDNEIDCISTITFTGGEPSLRPQFIIDTIQLCKELNISIGSFYVATNGVERNDKFLFACMELYLYCDDNEVSQVAISQSDWHYNQDSQWIKLLQTLRFCSKRESISYKHVISEGYGKQLNELNGTIDTARRISIPLMSDYDSIEDIEELYLNCNGDVCLSCDLSYIRQSHVKAGNIFSKTLEDMYHDSKRIEISS